VLRETISRSGNSGTADTAKQKRRVRSFFVRAARNNFPQQKQRDSGHNETKAVFAASLCALREKISRSGNSGAANTAK